MKQNATSIIRKPPLELLQYIEKSIGTDRLGAVSTQLRKDNVILYNEKEVEWKLLLNNQGELHKFKYLVAQELELQISKRQRISTWNKHSVDGIVIMSVLMKYNEICKKHYSHQQVELTDHIKTLEENFRVMQLNADSLKEAQLVCADTIASLESHSRQCKRAYEGFNHDFDNILSEMRQCEQKRLRIEQEVSVLYDIASYLI